MFAGGDVHRSAPVRRFDHAATELRQPDFQQATQIVVIVNQHDGRAGFLFRLLGTHFLPPFFRRLRGFLLFHFGWGDAVSANMFEPSGCGLVHRRRAPVRRFGGGESLLIHGGQDNTEKMFTKE